MTTTSTSGNLQPRQQVALIALMRTGSVSDSAAAAGVAERTLRRWMQTPQFSSAMRQAGRDNASEAVSVLLGAQLAAVAALRSALRTGSAATRVRAARALLELGLRAHDDDAQQRLDAIEQRVAEWDETTPKLRRA